MASTSSSDGWNISTIAGDQESLVEPSLESLPLYNISIYIWYVGAPVILLLGNFGNIMTIVVMQKMRSGELVVNTYFTGLAIVDLVTLDISLLINWAENASLLAVRNSNNVVCKIYTWISAGSTAVSAWSLVCLTIHRAMSVVWPHRVNLMCTHRSVFVLLVGIAGFFAAYYSHYFYGYSLVYQDQLGVYKCTMSPENYVEFVEEVFTYVDLVVYSLLPFVCLALANGVLVWRLKMSVKETRHKFAQTMSNQTEARQRATRSVTVTVILVSVAFIVLTLPVCIHYVIYFVAIFTHRLSVYQLAEVYLINAVMYLLTFSNSAVNFYLYCLTGKRFRDEFIKIIRCQRASKALRALAV